MCSCDHIDINDDNHDCRTVNDNLAKSDSINHCDNHNDNYRKISDEIYCHTILMIITTIDIICMLV